MPQESDNPFIDMAENAPDAIVILSEDGRVCYANRMAGEISGYSRSDLTCMNFAEIAPRYSRVAVYMDRGRTTSDSCGYIETRLIHRQGKKLYVELSASATMWEGKSAILLIFRNITARKRAERRLIDSCDELQRQIGKRDLAMEKTATELERKQDELARLKLEGKRIGCVLLETNNAVTLLARNVNQHRLQAEKKIAITINSKIMPIVEDLRRKNNLVDVKTGLEMLNAHLQTVARELLGEMNVSVRLSPSELQIATMVKNGLTTPEIAQRLHISPQTVKTHRRNIRKKLDIHAPGANLTAFLKSVLD